ncbi:MAG: hypothetical protein RLZZ627_1528 [Pseudomonadota bacterium]|jgi:hypothetical protein
MDKNIFQGLPLLVVAMFTAGCTMIPPGISTVTYYNYGAAMPLLRPLDAYPINVLVQDLRPEILSLKKIPLYVGKAENGFGEVRDVLNRDDCPVPVSVHRTPHCLSFAESLSHRIKSSKTMPTRETSQGLLLVEIRTWDTHAGAELFLDYAIDVYLRSNSGERLGSASIQGSHEKIDTQEVGKMSFANHVEKEERLSAIVAGVLDAKIAQLLQGPLQKALFDLR